MAGDNNFLVWNPGEVNQENDAAYLIDALRVGGAPTNALFSSLLANKLFYQVTMMAAAIAQCVSVAGQEALDTNLNDLANAIWNTFQPFPSGTVLGAFFQPSPPVGWTQITINNNKALRVVSGVGGGSGGVHDLSSPPSLAHIHTIVGSSFTFTGVDHIHSTPYHVHSTAGHVLSVAEMPSHNHAIPAKVNANNGGDVIIGQYRPDLNTSDNTGLAGGGGSHTHGNTGGEGGNTGSAGGGTVTGTTESGDSGSASPAAFSPKYVDVIMCSKN